MTVTCLMPGATATNFFRAAGMLDTKKVRAAVPHVSPDSALASMHRGMAEPGSSSRYATVGSVQTRAVDSAQFTAISMITRALVRQSAITSARGA